MAEAHFNIFGKSKLKLFSKPILWFLELTPKLPEGIHSGAFDESGTIQRVRNTSGISHYYQL